jgi:hypothetical protein
VLLGPEKYTDKLYTCTCPNNEIILVFERGMDLHFEIIRIEEIETDWRLKLN